MYIVYLLKSKKFANKSYVGMTIKPVDERLQEHNNGLSKFFFEERSVAQLVERRVWDAEVPGPNPGTPT